MRGTWRALCAVTATAALAPMSGCEQTNSARLAFASGSRGFLCRGQGGEPLYQRGIEGQALVMNLVVDFVALSGAPTCRIGQLSDHCLTSGCAPIVESRVCIPLTMDRPSSLASFGQALDEALEGLSGTIVTDSAPPGVVLVRVVGTAQPCSEVSGQIEFDCGRLMGCVWSCPTVLGEVNGDVVLDLDVGGQGCELEVLRCAAPHFGVDPDCR